MDRQHIYMQILCNVCSLLCFWDLSTQKLRLNLLVKSTQGVRHLPKSCENVSDISRIVRLSDRIVVCRQRILLRRPNNGG